MSGGTELGVQLNGEFPDSPTSYYSRMNFTAKNIRAGGDSGSYRSVRRKGASEEMLGGISPQLALRVGNTTFTFKSLGGR